MAVTCMFVGCIASNDSDLEEFKGEYFENFLLLYWNENAYLPCGSVENSSDLIGEKIATVDDGYKNESAVYTINGYSRNQWVIFRDTNIMETYTLYKEVDVKDMPTELEEQVYKYGKPNISVELEELVYKYVIERKYAKESQELSTD
jgi:hypothetical protein